MAAPIAHRNAERGTCPAMAQKFCFGPVKSRNRTGRSLTGCACLFRFGLLSPVDRTAEGAGPESRLEESDVCRPAWLREFLDLMLWFRMCEEMNEGDMPPRGETGMPFPSPVVRRRLNSGARLIAEKHALRESCAEGLRGVRQSLVPHPGEC